MLESTHDNRALFLFGGQLGIAREYNPIHLTNELKPQHLYIISDEPIKKGDFCYIRNHYNEYYIAVYNGKSFDIINEGGNYDPIIHKHCYKIIASTDKALQLNQDTSKCIADLVIENKIFLPVIPESIIQEYIKAYNEGNPIIEVALEYENVSANWQMLSDSGKQGSTIVPNKWELKTLDGFIVDTNRYLFKL